MESNVTLGVILHALGGLGAASFYVLFTRVRGWAWENYWMIGGLMLWAAWPWLVAGAMVPELGSVLRQISAADFWAAVILGIGWGIGNLTFGLSIRYLGFAGGYSITLGLIIVFGTLGPPLVKSWFPDLLTTMAGQVPLGKMLSTLPGRITLAGAPVMLLGVALCGLAGRRKDRELPDAAKQAVVHEFNFFKGMWVAVICGITSACINFALTDTDPIASIAKSYGATDLWANSVTMAIVLSAGGLANIAWCLFLNLRNGTMANYVQARRSPLFWNYVFCILAGTVAYSEFFFYALAVPMMGEYSFTNLPIHVALCIVLGSLWGMAFKEWHGTSRTTKAIVLSGIALLLTGTVVMGFGSALGPETSSAATAPMPAD